MKRNSRILKTPRINSQLHRELRKSKSKTPFALHTVYASKVFGVSYKHINDREAEKICKKKNKVEVTGTTN